MKQTERLNIEINKLRNNNGMDTSNTNKSTNDDVDDVNVADISHANAHDSNDVDPKGAELSPSEADLNDDSNKVKGSTSRTNRKSKLPLPLRSAESLRAELEADALVRNMKEQLGLEKLEHARQIKEHEVMIDKLRSENRQLIERHRFGGMEYDKAIKDVTTAVAAERREHEKETRDLRDKLAWYAENQDLLDKAEDEKSQLRRTLLSLRKELMRLKKAGIDSSDDAHMQALLDASDAGAGGDTSFSSNNNNLSATSGKRTRQYNRNPADIKRIKDLEKTVEDLQECLQKGILIVYRISSERQKYRNRWK